MAIAQAKFAERLFILSDFGNTILERLHFTHRTFSNPKARPAFANENTWAKMSETLKKKFPEIEGLEKTPGYDSFSQKAKPISDELEVHYFAFVDAFDFKEAALALLKDIASSTVQFTVDDNNIFLSEYIDLFLRYVQVNLLISEIAERKTILALYQKLYYYIKCQTEPNFGKIANYIISFASPITAMQDELKTLSSSLGKTLSGLIFLYSKGRSIQMLRKESALNITLKPEEMPRPTSNKFHFQFIHVPKILLYGLYGFLVVPEALALPGTMDLLKAMLGEGFEVPIYRDVSSQIHAEYENLFANSKSKTVPFNKMKRMPKEQLQEAVAKSPAKHRERRVYLRQELNSLVKLFADQPALLGPKFQMVLCALEFAREEIFWYFRHIKATPPKGTKKADDDYKDNRISELIYLVDQLITLVQTHKQVVQEYYAEYLRTTDFKKLSNIFGGTYLNSVGPVVGKISQAILDDIKNANPNSDFKALRLNWLRAEAMLSSVQSPAPLVKIRDAVDRFTLVFHHTKFVDEIDNLLDLHGSLKALYFYKESVYDHLTKSIKDGPNQPLHALAFLRLLGSFPELGNKYTSTLREDVGKEMVAKVEEVQNEISDRITALVREVYRQYLVFQNQLNEENAAFSQLSKKPDWKKPKDFTPPEQPGTESLYRRRVQYDRLRLYERNAAQLCAALNEFTKVKVFDHEFTPREYLRDKLAESLRKFLRTISIIEQPEESSSKKPVEKLIQRPSVILTRLNLFITVLRTVEHYVDMDIGAVVREVILGEVYIKSLGKSGNLDWVFADETNFQFNDAFIGEIVKWYGKFVFEKLPNPLHGIIYSPTRKSFVSKTGAPFKAELYADISEMKALATLVGPYGLKLIDREILKGISTQMVNLKEYLSHNKAALEELVKGYTIEATSNEIILKKFKDVDAFAQKSILIGTAMHFRDLMHEGLRQAVEEKVPYIFNTVHTCYRQYKRNTFIASELLAIDCLAYDCGIKLTTADQAFKRFLGRAIGTAEAPLWDLLPYMFAVSFYSQSFRETSFKAVVEGHHNNAHSLMKCVNELIVGFKAIVSQNSDEQEIIDALKTFLDVSSVLLLRLSTATHKDKFAPQDYSSVVISMDKFIQESPLLTRDVLEDSIPYALLRNHYRTLYANPLDAKGKREVGERDVY